MSAGAGRRFRPEYLVLWLAVAAACAIRLEYWWRDKAFWRDELALIQSLDSYPLGRLLTGPLADSQSAPPGWLLLERLVTLVFADGERAYRLLPVLAGCGAVALTAVLALRFVRRPLAAVVPVLAIATISQVVFYTAQTKQYSMDMLLVTGLLVLAVRMVRRPPGRRVELLVYGGVALGAWFSHGLMLTAPVVLGWIALVSWRKGYRTLPQLVARLVAPAVSVLLAALWARHLTSLVADFQTYWSGFMRPGRDELIGWHLFLARDFVVRNLGMPVVWAGGFVLLGLAIAGWRRWSRTSAVLLVLPLVPAYLAALARIYPFGQRLVLYCVPALLVGLAVLVDWVAGLVRTALSGRVGDGSSRPARVARIAGPVAGPVAGIVAGAVLVVGIGTIGWTTPGKLQNDLRFLFGADDYRVALRLVESKWKPGDVLVSGHADRVAVRVYGERLGLPNEAMFYATPSLDPETREPERGGPDRSCPLPRKITAAPRVWLVSGDLTTVYEGELSRNALKLPMIDRYRQVWFEDKGLVSMQVMMPGPNEEPPEAPPCLDYTPTGPVPDGPPPPSSS